MNKKKIKKTAEKYRKKIGKKAIEKIEKYLEEKIEEILKRASKQAEFSGRKTIKEEDVLAVFEKINEEKETFW